MIIWEENIFNQIWDGVNFSKSADIDEDKCIAEQLYCQLMGWA